MLDETHDPSARSWIESADAHRDFPVQNLPLGVFSPPGGGQRIGIAIGDYILDMSGLAAVDGLTPAVRERLSTSTLNPLFGAPQQVRQALRREVWRLLTAPASRWKVEPHLHVQDTCAMLLPTRIGDYTDFYVGIHHATNVGRLFRPENPLLPNYKHVPIGYHGRASSVRPSGAPVVRPRGQTKGPDPAVPIFGPTRRLDFELELGIWVGPGNRQGEPIEIARAQEHIVGLCLLNDWSARDLQAWEYQPLGPFLSKNFHTTISPWVVTSEALAPFRIAQSERPPGDPRPLDYLWDEADQARGALAIELEASLLTQRMRSLGEPPHRLSRTQASHMYWTAAQMLTHHASNGCNLQPGDLLGTGTISAPMNEGLGSLLEITAGGAQPIVLANGEGRTFLEDGDEILFSARAQAPGYVPIGFGECRAIVTPSPWSLGSPLGATDAL